MSLAILGLSVATPPAVVAQTEALEITRKLCKPTDERATWLPTLFQQSGIRRRHLALGAEVIRDVLEGTERSQSPFLPRVEKPLGPSTGERMREYARLAGPLALAAARGALASAGRQPHDITHLVTVSCTGFHAPGIDIELLQGLDLLPTTQRAHIGFMGCHGALNGLRVARALVSAEPGTCVLLAAVEVCSLHFCFDWDPQRLVANALFGDGAAALIGAAEGPPTAWRHVASGSCVFPDSTGAMRWTIGDHGFEMTLSKEVPRLLQRHLRPWLETWLVEQGLSLKDVGSWCFHPGGPKILDAVQEALALTSVDLEGSREVLAQCGNMSSPTLLFLLERLRRREAARPAVALGFGPGLTAEVALFE